MATELRAKVSATLTREFFDEGQAEALADAVLLALGLGEGGENVIVPCVCTPAMEAAHFAAHANSKSIFADVGEVWRAMLEARP